MNELTHAMFCMFPPSVNWRGTQYVLAVIEKRRGEGEERERGGRGEGEGRERGGRGEGEGRERGGRGEGEGRERGGRG